MFPHDYFAAGMFAPSYFPPVDMVGPDLLSHIVGHLRRQIPPAPEPFDTDDAFLLMLT